MAYIPDETRYEEAFQAIAGDPESVLPPIFAGVVAKLRRKQRFRDRTRGNPARLRSRRDALRPGQQLRAAYGSAEENFGENLVRTFAAIERDDHLD